MHACQWKSHHQGFRWLTACSGKYNNDQVTYFSWGAAENFKTAEVPKEAKPYYDLCNGSYVQCYILDKGNEVITYKPNPNAKEVYKPLDYTSFRRLIG